MNVRMYPQECPLPAYRSFVRQIIFCLCFVSFEQTETTLHRKCGSCFLLFRVGVLISFKHVSYQSFLALKQLRKTDVPALKYFWHADCSTCGLSPESSVDKPDKGIKQWNLTKSYDHLWNWWKRVHTSCCSLSYVYQMRNKAVNRTIKSSQWRIVILDTR